MFLFTLCVINALVLLTQRPKYTSSNLENNIKNNKNFGNLIYIGMLSRFKSAVANKWL